MLSFTRYAVLSLVLVAASSSSWAMFRCADASGRMSFQDKPCEGAGAKMDVRPNGGARAAVAGT